MLTPAVGGGPSVLRASSVGEEAGGYAYRRRPRVVWTPALHRRFEQVVNNLGVDEAVPTTILEVRAAALRRPARDI